MRHANVTIPSDHGIDWKGLGYLISILSVFLLGTVAWPKDNPPVWYHSMLIAGMVTSILGMASRYKAHLDQQREIRKAKAEAESPSARRPI